MSSDFHPDVEPAAPQRSARKRKGQGGERREEIVQHAIRLFAQRGVHTVSTRHIAEAVGVSQPTLYAYFPTKDALLIEACRRAFDELTRRMKAAAAGPGDPLEAMGRAYILFGLEQPDAYRIAFMLEGEPHDPLAPPPAMEEKLHVGRDCFGLLLEAVRARLGAGHAEVDVTAQSLWASQHGLVSLLIARAAFPWVDRELLIDFHVRRLIASLPVAASR